MDTNSLRTLKRVNDYFINTLTLSAFDGSSYDIRDIAYNLEWTENIFDQFVTGKVFINDSLDLINLFPIIGEEILEISITKPESSKKEGLLPPYKQKYRVYKITDKVLHKDKHITYVLHFCSEEFLKTNCKIMEAFKGLRYSEMISKIYDQCLKVDKPIIVEESQGTKQYNFRSLNPLKAINNIKNLSYSSAGSHYVFYEDKDNFNLKTLSGLIKQPINLDFHYGARNLLLEGNDHNLESFQKNVNTYHNLSSFDIVENFRSGLYASKLKTFDILQFKYNEKEFNYNEQFSEFEHLSSKKQFSKNLNTFNVDSNEFLISTQKDHQELGFENIENNEEEFYQKRLSKLFQFNQRLILFVSGDPRIKVGETCSFFLPETTGIVSKEYPQKENQYISGKYLISGVTHQLDHTDYKMSVEIIRDSFNTTPEHIDVIREMKKITTI